MKYSYICPKCGESTIMTANFSNAASNDDKERFSISKWLYKLSYRRPKLCMECFYLGFDSRQQVRNIPFGLMLFFLGIILIPFGYANPLTLLGSIFFIYLGIVSISMCFIDSNKCPQCNKNTLVHLESDAAKIIIEHKNLNVPVEIIQPKLPLINKFVVEFIGAVLLFSIAMLYLRLYHYFEQFQR
jgi:hypothetical protein